MKLNSFKNSLKLNLLIKLILLSGFILFLESFHLYNISMQKLNTQLLRKANSITDVVYINLSTRIEKGNLTRLINYLSAGNNLLEFYIIDQNDKIVSSLRNQEVDKFKKDIKKEILSEIKKGNTQFNAFSNQFNFKLNLNINNHPSLKNVTIFLKINTENEQKSFIRDMLISPLYTLLMLILFSSFIYWFVNKSILGPINFAVDYCSAYAKGLKLNSLDYSKEDEIGKIYHSLNLMIVDLEEKNKKLEKAKEAAQEANKAKSRFLSNMSHEIRTPLNSIIGFSEVLFSENLTKKQQATLKNVILSSKHLLQLINNILDLSKIEVEKIEFDYLTVNLKQEIDKIVNIINFKSKNTTCDFIVETDGIEVNNVIIDPLRFTQIIVNLVGNAAKFTEQGSVTLKVISKVESDSEILINIDIMDTGIGVSPEDQEKLFNPFEQVDSASNRKFSGTGLGLSITKKLIHLMGGEITLESELGKGSNFRVSLLVSPGDVNKISYIKEEKAVTEETINYEELHILIAEDNPFNQQLMKKYLEKINVKYTFAQNGLEVIDLLEREKFFLIFMDIQMPQMDGLMATEIIRKNEKFKDIPICGLSANAFKEDKELALKTGMDFYLEKPVSKKQIIEVLNKIATQETNKKIS